MAQVVVEVPVNLETETTRTQPPLGRDFLPDPGFPESADDAAWYFGVAAHAVGFFGASFESSGSRVWDSARVEAAHGRRRMRQFREAAGRLRRVDAILRGLDSIHREVLRLVYTPDARLSKQLREKMRIQRDANVAGLAEFTHAARELRDRRKPGETMREFLEWEGSQSKDAKHVPARLLKIRDEGVEMLRIALEAFNALRVTREDVARADERERQHGDRAAAAARAAALAKLAPLRTVPGVPLETHQGKVAKIAQLMAMLRPVESAA